MPSRAILMVDTPLNLCPFERVQSRLSRGFEKTGEILEEKGYGLFLTRQCKSSDGNTAHTMAPSVQDVDDDCACSLSFRQSGAGQVIWPMFP